MHKNLIFCSLTAICAIMLSGCGGKTSRQTETEFSSVAVHGKIVGEGEVENLDALAEGEGQQESGYAAAVGEVGADAGLPADGEISDSGAKNAEKGGIVGTQPEEAGGNVRLQTGDRAEKPEADGQAPEAADGTGQRGRGETEPGMPGALSVTGTQLTDAGGEPVQLMGISTHGLSWYPEYVNAECFRQLREEWGMNVVRLAMYTAENGGYCTGGDQEELKRLVEEGVSYATDCGMYVIIDWHILSDGNPNTYIEEAKGFFGEMAEEYSEYSNVIYEICNEPNGGVSWSEVKKYAEQIIEVIRKKDGDAIILVGTPNWCQYVEQAAEDPITGYDNIMYTLHFYAATHKDSLRDAMEKAVEAGLPIFVSEYGICDASGNGAIDRRQADSWAELLDEYGISHVAWNLSNKSETCAVLKSSCRKVSGFSVEDLSDSGKWLYERLGAGSDAGDERKDAKADMSYPEGTAGHTGNSGDGADNGRNPGKDSGGSGESGTGGNNSSGTRENESRRSGKTAEPDSLETAYRIVNTWEQDGGTWFQYELAISNPGSTEQNGWTVRLHFTHDISLQDSWNGIYAAEGCELTISSMDYNSFIPADGSVENVGFIIKADGECRLAE